MIVLCNPKPGHVAQNSIFNKKTNEEISLICTSEACDRFYFVYKNPSSGDPQVISKVFASKDDFQNLLSKVHQKNKKDYFGFTKQVSHDIDPNRPILFGVISFGIGPILTTAVDAGAAPMRIIANSKNKKSTKRIVEIAENERDQYLDEKNFKRVLDKLVEALN